MDIVNKVFLIDDSVAVNKRNKSLLKNMGLFEEIQMYSNPEDVLNLLENKFERLNVNELPDIIFLDIEMPEMNAFDFLERYGKIASIVDSQFKPIIIILSENLLKGHNFDLLKRYSNIGLCDQFTKPIDEQDVKIILQEYIFD